jgi:CheY-like chemotaxis protein
MSTEVLASEGIAVRTAQCARDALIMVKSWRPDVLVSDIAMPDQDGYAFIRHVRALPREEGGGVPALALTAYARHEDRVNVLAAGFQLHATKPVASDELLALVAHASKLAPQ